MEAIPLPDFVFYQRREIILCLECHCVCPLVRFGSAHLLSRKRVCPPPEPKGGQHSTEGEGVGGSNSEDWRESLALCLLCV
jgi:hypothetical protein